MIVTYLFNVGGRKSWGCHATAMRPYKGQTDDFACNECLWIVPGTEG